jgi:hypothetical protein
MPDLTPASANDNLTPAQRTQMRRIIGFADELGMHAGEYLAMLTLPDADRELLSRHLGLRPVAPEAAE